MQKNKKIILITGGRGFIAKNIIYKLKQKYFIYVTCSKSLKNKIDIIYLNIKLIKDLNTLKKLKIDYLINCHGKIKNDDYDEIYNDHYVFCKNLLETINIINLKKIIHMGSVDEISDNISGKDKYIKEKPTSHYGVIKLMVSKLIREFANKNKIDYIILRIFLVYGPGQKKPRLIPYLIDCIKKNKVANISDITAKKIFTHIDILTKVVEVFLTKKMRKNTYNLSTNKYVSLFKIINYLKKNYDLKTINNKKIIPKSQYLDDCQLLNEITITKQNIFNDLDKIMNNE